MVIVDGAAIRPCKCESRLIPRSPMHRSLPKVLVGFVIEITAIASYRNAPLERGAFCEVELQICRGR
jgi:hypothetical protein